MTPQARVQAAIDLLDEIVVAARGNGPAADTLIARYFKTRRYAGSKDRRAVRDHVYAAIRRSGEAPESGRAAMIGVASEQPELLPLFDGSSHGPPAIQVDEAGAARAIAPSWLIERLAVTVPVPEMEALLQRAPLDVRVNRLKSDRTSVARAMTGSSPTPHAPDGLRFPEGTQIEQHPQWDEGLIEIQDEGSQLVALGAAAKPGMTVIDLCAGAGGKTLALAAMMANEGRIIACDVDRGRLSRLAPRAERAGATIVETRLLNPNREMEALADLEGHADVVLIDAPCSGSGTWRRNPETRWRLSPAGLDRIVVVQRRLLDLATRLARPGGAVVYVVCSLLADEGPDQIKAFLARRPGWHARLIELPAGRRSGPGVMLTPAHDGTDGFFIASLSVPC